MKGLLHILSTAGLLMLLFLPTAVSAQQDLIGKVDTLYAELAKIDDFNWSVTISLTNDEALVGLSLPFELIGGRGVRVVGDSAVFTGGRVENFDYKGFRSDSSIQCVTLGLLANLSNAKKELAPGRGRLVTFFVSSLDNKPIEKLIIDTTTTSPSNSMMLVAPMVSAAGDTIPFERRKDREIIPALVIREAK